MSWYDLLAGLGVAAILEGLVLALAPGRLDEIVEMLRSIPVPARRQIGLAVVALGVTLLWIARS